MSNSELWLYAVEKVLSHVQNRQVERRIQASIDAAGGNISRALVEGDFDGMGDFGSYGLKRPGIQCHGSVPRTPISVWRPGRDIMEEPDLIVTWREVFEYVKNGKQKYFQMSLFEVA